MYASENTERRATAREARAIRRYETHKESAAAKLETKARHTARAFKYAKPAI